MTGPRVRARGARVPSPGGSLARRALLVPPVVALALLVPAPGAVGLSCAASDPRASLNAGSVLLVGRLGEDGDVDVDLSVGARTPARVRLLLSAEDASWMSWWRPGPTELAVAVRPEGDGYRLGPCSQADPDAVRRVARPVPAPPDGARVTHLATTDLPGGELALLDDRGEELGWAPAADPLLLAVCPGDRVVVVSVAREPGGDWWTRHLEVRDVDTLAVRWRTEDGPYTAATCEDPDGTRLTTWRTGEGRRFATTAAGSTELAPSPEPGSPGVRDVLAQPTTHHHLQVVTVTGTSADPALTTPPPAPVLGPLAEPPPGSATGSPAGPASGSPGTAVAAAAALAAASGLVLVQRRRRPRPLDPPAPRAGDGGRA